MSNKNELAKIGTNASNVTLRGWQQDVINEIEHHEERRDSEASQGQADFQLNRALSVAIAMPKGSGHTFLTSYIASKYPTLVVYGRMEHYKRIIEQFPLHAQSETVSFYEMYFAMYKNPQQPSLELHEIRKKFDRKQVVVIDNALGMADDIKNFVYDSARGIVVMLGH